VREQLVAATDCCERALTTDSANFRLITVRFRPKLQTFTA
jgi:hypothetical protein